MYSLISISVLILSTLLFRKVAGSLSFTKLNAISWIFYFQLILQSFIASFLVINNWDNHYVISKTGEEAKFLGWLAVQYTMLALPLGMWFVLYVKGYTNNRRIFNDYINRPIQTSISPEDSFVRTPLYLLSIICILAVVYTLISLRVNPFTAIFQGLDTMALAGLRIEASRGFEGNQYFRNIFGITLTPILTYIAYSYWNASKRTLDFAWFVVLLLSSTAILTYDLAKSPIVFFVLGFLFLAVLINGGVKKSTLYIFGGMAFGLILLAYIFIAQTVDVSVLFGYNSGIGGRVLLSQAAGTYFAFEHFPKSHEFIGLASFSDILNQILGLEPTERAARIMMTIFNPEGVEQGTAGVMNSLFVAEAYANFGFAGLIIAPFYVGAFIQMVFLFFITTGKTPLKLGLLAYLSYKLPVTGGFNDFFYNAGLMLVAFVFITIYLSALILRKLQEEK